ncbi:hypothetical protein AB205_0209350 [Aquarana catesbeiana]|uniref:Uncharacterized protein n=1 Tax=Aquarana catesbeiana TaxID=8400 RepID=A0A2G9QD94_AQUCT|nr:hypothetical protein AB205_0209350 [Aquarana catesbeiana]
MRRETFWKWAKMSPQQVMWMLWKKNLISPVKVPRSWTKWGAIAIQKILSKTSMMLKKN